MSSVKLYSTFREDLYEIRELVDRIKNESISICTWGVCGKLLFKWCEENSIKINNIYDESDTKKGKYVFEIQIEKYDVIANKECDDIYVIATYNNYIFNEVYLKLKGLGIDSKNIIHISLMERNEFERCFNFEIYYKKYKNSLEILDNYSLIEQIINIFQDEYSKKVYAKMISRHYNGYEFTIPDDYFVKETYFERDFFSYGKEEVLIQCGVLDGATIRDFIRVVPDYKQIVGIEADPNNYKKSAFVESEKNVLLINKAILDEDGKKIEFCALGNGRSHVLNKGDVVLANTRDLNAMRETENSNCIIESIRGDSLEIEPTIIQMDIEGAELSALKGFEKTIKNVKPKLAICIYHSINDFWEIPKYIHNLVPEYRLFIRNDGKFNKNNETVLYATL